MRNKWLNIFVIVFTAILWAMQMIPDPEDGEFFWLPYLRMSKYWIALFSFCFGDKVTELLCLQLEKLPLIAEHALEMVSF